MVSRDLMDHDGLAWHTSDVNVKVYCHWCSKRLKRNSVGLRERLLPGVETVIGTNQVLWLHTRCWRYHLEQSQRRQIARRVANAGR